MASKKKKKNNNRQNSQNHSVNPAGNTIEPLSGADFETALAQVVAAAPEEPETGIVIPQVESIPVPVPEDPVTPDDFDFDQTSDGDLTAEEPDFQENKSTEETASEEPVPAVMPKTVPAPADRKKMLRTAVVLACLLAASAMIVSTVHVLTRDAIRSNEQTAVSDSFAELFPDANAVREYTADDGTTVWLAVIDGQITGYCTRDGGTMIGYTADGSPMGAVNIGTGETLEIPDETCIIDLTGAAVDLNLTVIPEETEPSANEDNGMEEIQIGEAGEEGSETVPEIPDTAEPETEPAPETEPEPETEPKTQPAEPDVPVIEEPIETEPEPELPDVPVAAETEPEPETTLETQPETELETWWTPETEPETQWTPETEPETWWTPEPEPETQWTPETQPDTEWAEAELTESDTEWTETEPQPETEPIDTDMTGADTEPAETAESAEPETEPDESEISVEVEVEVEEPAEEETEQKTEETQKAETKKKSGSGLFR